MEGLCRAVGSPLPVKWLGRVRLLYPLRLRDIGTMEWWIIENRADPIKRLAKVSQRISRESFLMAFSVAADKKKAIKPSATPDEIEEFLESRTGLIMSLWLMFREEFGYEEVQEVVCGWRERVIAEWIHRLNLVSGLDSSADLDWPVVNDATMSDDGKTAQRSVKQDTKFNWKNAVRAIAEGYMGITPQAIGEMTLYEFREMVSERNSVANKRTVSRFAAKDDPAVLQALKDWKEKSGVR